MPLLLGSVRSLLLLTTALAAGPLLAAAPPATPPPNVGGGLRQLLQTEATAAATPAPTGPTARREALRRPNPTVQRDAVGRVVMDVYLAPGGEEAALRKALTELGGEILAFVPAGRSPAAREGLFTVRLPLSAATAAGRLPGVRSVMLAHKPQRRAGRVTSQGVVTQNSFRLLRRGLSGNGLTVGVISDSYDLTRPHARVDSAGGDLPNTTATPVTLVREGDPSDATNTDEGRAMLQIVHDVAPRAKLAFASAGVSQATFADSIRRLRTQGDALCDVIVDDISFFEEPFFSAGLVEQAVQEVVNSATLPGRPVAYFSAAGNDGGSGYEANFQPVSEADARAGQAGLNNLHLEQVPAELTGGGFHNFGTAGAVQIAQALTASLEVATLIFQWNDPFNAGGISSDFNLLVFDEQGNYLENLSGTDNNTATGQPLEFATLYPKADGEPYGYQVVIARRAGGTGEAQHFRYLATTDGLLDGDFLQQDVPTTYGHSAARDAQGVGAFRFNLLTRPEAFSSFGPATYYFDDAGNRLQTPEVRSQPSICSADGVLTSLPAFRPFFGTSAAAPHAAGAAALLLEAAGGPGSLPPATLRQTLEETARPHDLDPTGATATLSGVAGTVTLSGSGGDEDASSSNRDFFTLEFSGPAGSQLRTVIIDLGPAGLVFDDSADTGFPFTVGNASGGVNPQVTATLARGSTGAPKGRLTLQFSAFPSGGSLTFGIDRDLARTRASGNNGQALLGGRVTASVQAAGATRPVALTGLFRDVLGRGYGRQTGYGLLDADAAWAALRQIP